MSTEIVEIPALLEIKPFPSLGSANYNQEAYDNGVSVPPAIERAREIVEAGRTNALAAHEHAQSAGESAQAAHEDRLGTEAARDRAEQAGVIVGRFDKLFLGPKTYFPETDNEGQPLLAGAEFFHTVDPVGRFSWTGTAWKIGTQVTAGVATINGRDGDVTLVPEDVAPLGTSADILAGVEEAPRMFSPESIAGAFQAFSAGALDVGAEYVGVNRPSVDWVEGGKLYLKAQYPKLAAKLGTRMQPESAKFLPAQTFNIPDRCVVPTQGAGGRWLFNLARNTDKNQLLWTDDMQEWTICNTSFAAAVYAYANGVYFAFPTAASTSFWTSTDLQNWQARTLPSAISVGGVLYTGAEYVIFANAGTTFFTATALDAWTARTGGATGAIGSIAGAQALGKALIGGASSCFLYDYAARTLTAVTLPAGFGGNYSKVVFTGQQFVLTSSDATKPAYTSPDGVNFFARSAAVATLNLLHAGDGTCVALAANGTAAVSVDHGFTWVSKTAKAHTQSLVTGGFLYLVQDYGMTRTPVSALSGAWVWEPAPAIPYGSVRAITPDLYRKSFANSTPSKGGFVIGLTQSGMLRSSDGKSWKLYGAFGRVWVMDGLFVSFNAQNGITTDYPLMTSEDGVTWTRRAAASFGTSSGNSVEIGGCSKRLEAYAIGDPTTMRISYDKGETWASGTGGRFLAWSGDTALLSDGSTTKDFVTFTASRPLNWTVPPQPTVTAGNQTAGTGINYASKPGEGCVRFSVPASTFGATYTIAEGLRLYGTVPPSSEWSNTTTYACAEISELVLVLSNNPSTQGSLYLSIAEATPTLQMTAATSMSIPVEIGRVMDMETLGNTAVVVSSTGKLAALVPGYDTESYFYVPRRVFSDRLTKLWVKAQ